MAKAQIFSEKAQLAVSVLFLNSRQRAAQIVCAALLKLSMHVLLDSTSRCRESNSLVFVNAGDRIHIHSAFVPLFGPEEKKFHGDAQILSAKPFRIQHLVLRFPLNNLYELVPCFPLNN